MAKRMFMLLMVFVVKFNFLAAVERTKHVGRRLDGGLLSEPPPLHASRRENIADTAKPKRRPASVPGVVVVAAVRCASIFPGVMGGALRFLWILLYPFVSPCHFLFTKSDKRCLSQHFFRVNFSRSSRRCRHSYGPVPYHPPSESLSLSPSSPSQWCHHFQWFCKPGTEETHAKKHAPNDIRYLPLQFNPHG